MKYIYLFQSPTDSHILNFIHLSLHFLIIFYLFIVLVFIYFGFVLFIFFFLQKIDAKDYAPLLCASWRQDHHVTSTQASLPGSAPGAVIVSPGEAKGIRDTGREGSR